MRSALAGLWALIAVLCLALGFLMFGLFDQGVGTQLRQGNERIARAIDDAARRYGEYLRSSDADRFSPTGLQGRAELEMMATIALSGYQEVEGGFWNAEAGSLAYAFPTHGGPRVKTDLPQAELGAIKQVIDAALTAQKPVSQRFDSEHESLLLQARPLPGPPGGMAVWGMTRAPLDVGKSYQRLAYGLGALIVLALGSGVALLLMLRRWTRRVAALEEAIASTPVEQLPPLASTGERDLDRVVGALNRLNERLKAAHAEASRLEHDLGRADRLVSLGRIAAGLTHEIGNPLAAMRLRAENALSGDQARAQEALPIILLQIGRLEELLGGLRLLTQTLEIRPRAVALKPFLRACLSAVAPSANEAKITLALDPAPAAGQSWELDEKSLARALENLLLNAIQHSPAGGRVTLGVETSSTTCRFRLTDEGPGVNTTNAERIFEPFVTTRPDGVGLGLALVREIAEAHGGNVRVEPTTAGACGAVFTIEIPHGQNPDRR